MVNSSQVKKAELTYVDFCLMFRGHVGTEDIQNEFDVEEERAIVCLQRYMSLFDNNLIFEPGSQRYFQSKSFVPSFDHDSRQILNKLTSLVSATAESGTRYPVQGQSYINTPDINVLARLVQAMLNGNVVNIIYTSLTSGSSSREIVPHQILDNGLRWHVRAYDRRSDSFRDFVLTRISKATIKSNQVFQHEKQEVDWQWQQEITLVLKPHPKNISQPTAIEMDYGMLEGEKRIRTRAAIAGYLLRRWNVDSSENADLLDPAYQLWLSNRGELTDVQSLEFAPGI